jgi:uncharacterized protein YpmS
MDTDTARAAFWWIIIILAILSIFVFRVVIDRKVKRASVVREREKAEQAKKKWENIPNTTTEAQERTRMAVEGALRNTQQNAPPAARRSLSTRLAELDDALRAGQITEQDHAKARADIIASA